MSRNHSDRNYSDNYRPSASSNRFHPYQSHNTSSYRPSHNGTNNRYPSNSHNGNNRRAHHKDRTLQDHILDDQIAPKCASSTIATLTQWAKATEKFPAHEPRKNENQIVERIEARYGDFEGAVVPRFGNVGSSSEDDEGDGEEVFSMQGVDGKRGREEGWSAIRGLRDVKRRRMDGETVGVIDLTGENEDRDYAESSEWSWPGTDQE